MNYLLNIAYDGTNYCGWQVQKTKNSVQFIVQKVIEKILQEKISLTGSSRTDAGVHSYGQMALLKTQKNLNKYSFLYSINSILPSDIRVLDYLHVDDNFHPRYCSCGKTYYYHVCIDKFINPFFKLYRFHFPHPLDLSLIKKASKRFIGTHNFLSFANENNRGSASKNPIKTITEFNIVEETGGFRFEISADGFLYRMVRNIVGTLIDIGRQRIKFDELDNIFLAKDRKKGGKTAPAQGLFLMKVHFNNFSSGNSNNDSQ